MRRSSLLTLGALSCVLTACVGSDRSESPPAAASFGGSLAEEINAGTRALLPKKPGKNWVFDAYVSANSPSVAWSRFWTKNLDLSGVAWDKPQTLTMISPRHAVMARHYQRPPKAQFVTFHDRRGRAVERAIVGRVFLSNDIAVVILSEDVPDTVKSYPVPEPSERHPTELLGALAFVTDRERKVHVHEVRLLREPGIIAFSKASSLPDAYYEPLIKGDSGNPAFVWLHGELVLVETHTGGGPGIGAFYGDAGNVAAINEAMRGLSEEHGAPGYQLRTVRP